MSHPINPRTGFYGDGKGTQRWFIMTSETNHPIISFVHLADNMYTTKETEDQGIFMCMFRVNQDDMLNDHKKIIRSLLGKKIVPKILDELGGLTAQGVRKLILYAVGDDAEKRMELLKRSLVEYFPQNRIDMKDKTSYFPHTSVTMRIKEPVSP